jgi:5-formyltetrahydrofolate cyclo-ligase
VAPPSFAHSPPAASALREAKRALREHLLDARDRVPADLRAAASAAIGKALAERGDFATARTVLLTLPFGSEWDTLPLLLAALDRGKTVVLPRVDMATRSLELCRLTEPGRDVRPGYRGIPEPQSHCTLVKAETIDWVLVPGVAFDMAGRRLGYGGGYYDRLLPTLRSDVARIAGAYEMQLVERVPAAAHDLPVQELVTERRTVRIA